MRDNKINETEMLHLVNQGVPQADLAKRYGVTRAAISKRLKQVRAKTTKVVVAKKMERCIDKQIDAIEQLTEINGKTIALLEEAEAEQNKNMQLRCIAEARAQLKLCAEIQLSLFSQRDAHTFMQIITEALKEASPESYEKFKRIVSSERSVREVLRIT